MMPTLTVELKQPLRHDLRCDANGATDPAWQGHTPFVNRDDKATILPACHAGADPELLGGAQDGPATAFGHRPARAEIAIDRNIDGAMIQWVSPTAPGIIG